MNAIRQSAKQVRAHVAGGGLFTVEELAAKCVTLAEALTVFDGAPVETPEGIYPECCGGRAETSCGFLGSKVRCEKCGAEIRDALSPLYSPFLERGNSFVTVPGDELIELLGERNWIVMHEGDRP